MITFTLFLIFDASFFYITNSKLLLQFRLSKVFHFFFFSLFVNNFCCFSWLQKNVFRLLCSSNHQRYSIKQSVFEILQNLQESTCVGVFLSGFSFLIFSLSLTCTCLFHQKSSHQVLLYYGTLE